MLAVQSTSVKMDNSLDSTEHQGTAKHVTWPNSYASNTGNGSGLSHNDVSSKERAIHVG